MMSRGRAKPLRRSAGLNAAARCHILETYKRRAGRPLGNHSWSGEDDEAESLHIWRDVEGLQVDARALFVG